MIISFLKKQWILIICMIVIAVVPFVALYVENNFQTPQLPVEMTDDGLYYFGRAVEVSQGHTFIGNQYINEHKDDTTVAFFVADWVYSVPLLLGFSLGQAIVINQIIYFGILGLLIAFFLSLFSVNQNPNQKTILLATLGIVLSIYWFEARPVAMQVVYPVFLMFLIALFYFLKTYIHGDESKKSIVFLTAATALSLYIYTYLTQIAAIILFLCFCLSLFPNYKKLRSIFWSGVGVIFLAIPFLVYTWKQIHAPFYFETLARIGLVHTHLFGSAGLWYMGLALLPIGIVYISTRYSPEGFAWSLTERIFVYLVSGGLVISALSNVITGNDLETAVHIGRFTDLWIALVLGMVLIRYAVIRRKIHQVSCVLLVLLSFFVIKNIYEQGNNFIRIATRADFHQEYVEPLHWLATQTPPESVVFADDRFGSYIPVVTNNYLLFHPNAELYLMSDKETADRFITSRMFEHVSIESIFDSYRLFAGAGHAAHEANVHNRAVRVCSFLRLSIFEVKCGELTTTHVDAEIMYGKNYFTDLKKQHDVTQATRENQLAALAHYHVEYIVFDRARDAWSIASSTPSYLVPVFTSGDITILKVLY